MKKIVLIGPVYPYRGGISHYTGLMCRELSKRFEVEMLSYKMQYPKILFKKEQRDYENDSFKIDNAKYMIHTANPFNIIRTARYIRKKSRIWCWCNGGIPILRRVIFCLRNLWENKI